MSQDTNKHQDSAVRGLELSRTSGLTPHQVEKALQRAQVEATLAVAEELRTANLIAMAQMEHRNSDAVGFHPDYNIDPILERLGME